MADIMYKEIETLLKNKLEGHNIAYYTIENTDSITKIHDLFIHDKFFDPVNDIEYNHIGLYYKNVKKDYENAEKYYLMATERGNSNAMFNLASYYEKIKRDYINAEKYYLMATERGNANAMNNLVAHYIQKNESFKSVELCIKYPKLVLRGTIINVLNKVWIVKLDNREQNKYLIELLLLLELQPDDNIPTSLLLFNNLLHQNIDIMKLHFEYTINGKGYEEAKQDFINSVTKINNSQ